MEEIKYSIEMDFTHTKMVKRRENSKIEKKRSEK